MGLIIGVLAQFINVPYDSCSVLHSRKEGGFKWREFILSKLDSDDGAGRQVPSPGHARVEPVITRS